MFGSRIDQITLEISRVVLGIQCFTAGIQSPGKFISHEKQSMFILLGPVLLFMWGMSTLIIGYTFSLSWRDAMIIAACITPTDPILANGIVKGTFADEHVPRNLRNLIAAESGANDGVGLPLLYLPFFLNAYESYGKGFGWWVLVVWVYQVSCAFVLAVILGIGFRKVLKLAHYHNWMDKESFLGLSVAIAILLLGAFSRMGMDELLGCFIAGIVISWDEWINDQLEGSHIQEVLDSLLNISYFVFFGSRIPWAAFYPIGIWKIVVACILIMLFRRLPIVMALWKWIPALHSKEEAFFCGWFGPIGVGALYYAMYCVVIMKEPIEPLFGIVSSIVVCSVLVHSGSVGLFHIGLTRSRTLEQRSQYQQDMQSNFTLRSSIVVHNPSCE
jgi:NhaP-type Na+/H+ or K+/H+ antiporter